MVKFFGIQYAGQEMRIATRYVAFLRDGNPKKPGTKTHLMLGNASDSTALELAEPVEAVVARIRAADPTLALVQYTDERGNAGFVNPAYVYAVETGPKSTAIMRVFGVPLHINRLSTAQTLYEIVSRLESV